MNKENIDNKNIAFFDTETQHLFGENGIKNPAGLKLAVAGVLINDEVLYFEENQVEELFKILVNSKLVVGHNLYGFDYQVIQPYIKQDVFGLLGQKGKSLDMMFEIAKILGNKVKWVKLDDLASRNIGMSKPHEGNEIPRMWKEGKHDEVKSYLANDLKMTEAIYSYAIINKKLKYGHYEYGVSFGERELSLYW